MKRILKKEKLEIVIVFALYGDLECVYVSFAGMSILQTI